MIHIYSKNESGIKIERALLEKIKKVIRTAVKEEYPEHNFEVNILFCTDEEIQKYNSEYRNIDRPTDVLSFPMFEFDTPEVVAPLGDIIISVERAEAQAEEYGHSFEREICFLAAHSALHLLGYDHETDKEREEMEKKQREILDSLGIFRN